MADPELRQMQDAIGRLWEERTLLKQALLQVTKVRRADEARRIAEEALAKVKGA